jgi:hypothetical protein
MKILTQCGYYSRILCNLFQYSKNRGGGFIIDDLAAS